MQVTLCCQIETCLLLLLFKLKRQVQWKSQYCDYFVKEIAKPIHVLYHRAAIGSFYVLKHVQS